MYGSLSPHADRGHNTRFDVVSRRSCTARAFMTVQAYPYNLLERDPYALLPMQSHLGRCFHPRSQYLGIPPFRPEIEFHRSVDLRLQAQYRSPFLRPALLPKALGVPSCNAGPSRQTRFALLANFHSSETRHFNLFPNRSRHLCYKLLYRHVRILHERLGQESALLKEFLETPFDDFYSNLFGFPSSLACSCKRHAHAQPRHKKSHPAISKWGSSMQCA